MPPLSGTVGETLTVPSSACDLLAATLILSAPTVSVRALVAIIFGVESRNESGVSYEHRTIVCSRITLKTTSFHASPSSATCTMVFTLPPRAQFERLDLTVWASHDGVSPGVESQQPGQGLAGWRQQPWFVGRPAVAGCRQAPVDGPGRRQTVSGPVDGWQVMPLLRGHSPLRCARPGSGYRGRGGLHRGEGKPV